MLVDKNGKPLKIEKAALSETINQPMIMRSNPSERGINVYSATDLMGQNARTKSGEMVYGSVIRPVFTLSISERIELFKRSTILQGVATGRAKRIAGLNWKITSKSKNFDRFMSEMNELKEVYDEYAEAEDVRYAVAAAQLRKRIMSRVPGVLPDLSNFDRALYRLKKKFERSEADKTDDIAEWLNTPNAGESFYDLLHKWIIDMMIHGAVGLYKEWLGDDLENFYALPGGTVFPYRSMHVGGPTAYFQIIPGMEAKIYYEDEIAFSSYVPTSWETYGTVPVEALVNKLAESILFDRRAADQADGTKPPEKAVIFGKGPSPFGSLTSSGEFDMPMDSAEQKRIETKLNMARQEAIATLSGVGQPMVLDLSKSDTFTTQMQRQDKLIRDVALIYNMSNMEVNLAGGEFTSGKETSDAQKEIDQEKGVGPLIKTIQEIINRKILPFRFGWDYQFEFDTEPSEDEQVALEQKKMNTGTYSVNEIRENRGDDPYPEEEYNRPQEAGGQPDGTEENPLNMRGLM